jgi:hypothetical protein
MRSVLCLFLLPAIFTFLSAADNDAVAEFRKDLADNDKYPLRRGNALNIEALKSAVLKVRAENSVKLLQEYDTSYQSLPRRAAPHNRDYEQILFKQEFNFPKDSMAAYATLYPDIRKMAKLMLSSLLPLTLSGELGFSVSQIGNWMAFLTLAEPVLYRCDTDGKYVTVCLDYGGLDIFQLGFATEENIPIVKHLSWYRRKSKAIATP